MKILELVKKLEEIHKHHGDIEVKAMLPDTGIIQLHGVIDVRFDIIKVKEDPVFGAQECRVAMLDFEEG